MFLGLSILFLIFFVPGLFIYSEFFIRPKYLKNPVSINFINKYIYLFVSNHQLLLLAIIILEIIVGFIFDFYMKHFSS